MRLIRKLSSWCERVLSFPWFRNAEDLEKYLCDRADEPCGRTVFQGVVAAVLCMDRAAGFPDYLCFGDNASVTSLVKELELEVVQGKGKPRKKAKQILVQMICSLERIVVSDTEPLYIRAFAWLRCVMVWASLRSDDTMGIVPSSLVTDAGVLSMVLERTKTSGPGKADQVLHAYVSWEAFVEKPEWLGEGLEVWKMIGFDRDYFLGNPTPDLQAMVPVMASYQDRSCMARALARRLQTKNGQALFVSFLSIFFWTEHSPRCTRPTMVASLGGSKATRSKLGRWKSSSDTVEGYSQAADRLVICKAQSDTAAVIRKSGNSPLESENLSGDIFGESVVLDSLKAQLQSEGVSSDDIEATISNLTYFGSRSAEALEDAGAFDHQSASPNVEQFGEDTSPFNDFMALAEDGYGVLLPDEVVCIEADALISDAEAGIQDEDVDSDNSYHEIPAQLDYVTCRSAKTSTRRLHRVGWCWRVPGVDYKVFEIFADPPAPENYDVLCKQCWKFQSCQEPGSTIGEAVNDESSSTSSSSAADVYENMEELLAAEDEVKIL